MSGLTNRKAILIFGSILLLLVIIALIRPKTNKSALSKDPLSVLSLQYLSDAEGNELQADLFEAEMVYMLYFSSECDHCQRQVKDIMNNINSLNDVLILMISSQEISDVLDYLKQYQIEQNDQFYISFIEPENIEKKFGTVNVPLNIFYDSAHNLIRKTKGEAPVSEIIPLFHGSG